MKTLPDRLEEKFLVVVLAVCLAASLFFAETVVRTERTHIMENAKLQAEYLTELHDAGVDTRAIFLENHVTSDPRVSSFFENPELNPRVTGLRAKLSLSAILLAGVLVICMRVVFRNLVLGRVQGLEEATRALSRREPVHFPEPGDDEIGSLIVAFREMVVSLEHREAELTIRNEQLQSEIRGRKAAVESLRESENKFRVLFEQHADGILVMVDNKHVHSNVAAARMLGYSNAEEMLRLRPSDLWPSYQPDGSPSQDLSQQHTASALRDGTHRFEWVYRRRNGTPFWAEVIVTVIPFDGDRAQYLVIRDITDRKNEEEEHVRLTAAMEQTVEMIVVSDSEGYIQYVNPAFLSITGYSREDVIGKSHDFVHGHDPDTAVHEAIGQAIQNGEVWKGRLINQKKDGSHYRSESTVSPVRDSAGNIIDYVTVSHDVTKEARLEAQLVQAQKMEAIGELASGIAHEINTPTQYIGDNIRFLQESYQDIERLLDEYGELQAIQLEHEGANELRNKIEKIIEEIDLAYLREELPSAIEQSIEGNRRVAEIVRAMKEFAHPGSEDLSPTDINQSIQNTISVARNEWKYVAEVKTNLDPALPMVNCVPGAFNQVVLNLFVNAAHAIREVFEKTEETKGTITVSTKHDGDWVEIRIKDTGIGIPRKIQTKIFDPFFTTKGVGKGTGQGLAMAHAVIVEKHGGSLTFETEEGKGTAFIIRLRVSGSLAGKIEAEETPHVHGDANQHAHA